MRLLSLASVVALAASTVVAAGPAGTAPPPEPVYDALGDSYASGAGVLPYDGPTCQRSLQAPARLVDGRMRIRLDDFVACGGARAVDIEGQVAALDEHTDLVTVSVGGNDIGWSEAVTACVGAGLPVCQGAVGQAQAKAENVLPDLLDTAYAQIHDAAPDAHVVVTGYAHLFTPEDGDWALGGSYVVTAAEQEVLNAGADALNAVIRTQADEHGFQFVDVTKRFDGHGVNSTDPWILGIPSPAPFHPNLTGYQAYAAAITAAVNPRDLR